MKTLAIVPEGYRAHGLGNDYLVFEAVDPAPAGVDQRGGSGPIDPIGLTPAAVRSICHRTRGVGSDGIVVLLDPDPSDGIFPLRMFNPDGSEFERSGNGLRVLGAFLHRAGHVAEGERFRVRSGGSEIDMTLHSVSAEGIFDLSIQMGRAATGVDEVGLATEHLDSAKRVVHPDLGPLDIHPVSVGNPHAVIFTSDLSSEHLRTIGSFLVRHPAFPHGTNVQLADVRGPRDLRIAIWERGVGQTEASGTSSCAAAVAAVDTGRMPPGSIAVTMQGGLLAVEVGESLDVVLRGPVQEVGRTVIAETFVRWMAGKAG